MAESDNKRVARNTLVLYLRMFITMLIGMWTSRIVLNALGFTDQGLYNLVGGFVGMLSIVSSSIRYSIIRFLTFEIGKGDLNRVNSVYRNANTVQLFLTILVLAIAESIGLWAVNYKLVIPPDRLFATNVVYQLSVFNFCLSLMTSPQSAFIVAHEKLSIYAYVAVATSILTFGIAIAISHSGIDRLILYSSLLFALSFATRIFYIIYIRRKFTWIKSGFEISKEYFKPIFGFAGWNMIGASASVLRNSGTGILLNLFGGPIANTINGIANSANHLVNLFVSDFTTAYNPQIIKKYAQGKYSELIIFLHRTSKFSFCLMAILAIPIIVNIHTLLILWLKNIPVGTAIFAQLVILCSLCDSISQPLWTAKNATGNIKNYQIVVGGINLLSLPLSYLFLKIGCPLYYTYISVLITSILAFFARMTMLKGSIPGWRSSYFMKHIVSRCLLLIIIGMIFQISMKMVMPDNQISILVQCFVGFLFCCLLVLYMVCTKGERIALLQLVKKTILRYFNRND